ncbi:MbnP family protein, partial [Acinetobacter baumannii]
KDLQLFTETYTNKFGESFTVNRFKYYISKIILIDSDSKYYAFPSDYFLIDEADSLSKTITLTTAAKKINDIQFLIGI